VCCSVAVELRPGRQTDRQTDRQKRAGEQQVQWSSRLYLWHQVRVSRDDNELGGLGEEEEAADEWGRSGNAE